MNKPAENAEPALTEAEYLAKQSADAKAAITRTLTDIGNGLGQSVNLNNWTRQYPWMTLGASTIAGFVAAAALVPSKEDQALRKLAKIERALNRETSPKKPPHDSGNHHLESRPTQKSLGWTILGHLIKALQPALLSVLTAGVAAHTAKPSEEEMHATAAAQDGEIPVE